MQEKSKKISEISERLRQLIDYLGVNPNSFANSLGYRRSQAIYDMLNGKSKPSFDFFQRLLVSEYSELVNLKWLIIGIGPIQPSSSSVQPERVIEQQVDSDPPPSCQQCLIKDQVIESKQEAIDALHKTVKALESQIEMLNQGQKRKAG